MEATSAPSICYLPHATTENILFRLPLKYLLQFKSVCKKWNSTISDDPHFAQIYARQSQISNASSWLVEHVSRSREKAQVLKLEDDEFRVVSTFDHPQPKRKHWRCECHCEGLYVMSTRSDNMYGMEFALWNPSRGWHARLKPTKIFRSCSNRVVDWMIAGICYDASSKDYKVVFLFGNNNLYLVFSCRSNSWSSLREIDISSFHGNAFHRSVSFDGSVYWLSYSQKDHAIEIVSFDGKDEKFKKVKENVVAESAVLISSMEGLYLFKYYGSDDYEIIFMKKKQQEEWMEIKVELPRNIGRVDPLGCTYGNMIILCRHSGTHPRPLYYYSNKPSSHVKIIRDYTSKCYNFFPYAENLLSNI